MVQSKSERLVSIWPLKGCIIGICGHKVLEGIHASLSGDDDDLSYLVRLPHVFVSRLSVSSACPWLESQGSRHVARNRTLDSSVISGGWQLVIKT